MKDLRAYRCQILLDNLGDIPQNMTILLGEESFPVMVHLEHWERIAVGGRGDPPAPPGEDQGDGSLMGGGPRNGGRGSPEHDDGDVERGDEVGEVDDVVNDNSNVRAGSSGLLAGSSAWAAGRPAGNNGGGPTMATGGEWIEVKRRRVRHPRSGGTKWVPKSKFAMIGEEGGEGRKPREGASSNWRLPSAPSLNKWAWGRSPI